MIGEREASDTRAQVEALRAGRFGALRVPVADGGGGAGVRELLAAVMTVAADDPDLAQVWRAHFGFTEHALLQPEPQRARLLEPIVDGLLIGNAVTEIGTAAAGDFGALRTTIAPDADGWRIDGTKYFSTGTLYADLVWVWGVTPEGAPISALVPTGRTGVTVVDDWDGFGQQRSGSGTTRFEAVRATPEEVQPPLAASPARLPLGAHQQLYLTAIVAGVVRAIRDDATALLRGRARGVTHGTTPRPQDDPVLLAVVGALAADAAGAQAVVLHAADALARAFAAVGTPAGDAAAHEASRVAAEAKIAVDRIGLRAASRLFEAGGASATRAGAALDRHWRAIRTLASHNPSPLKSRAVGDLLVNGTPLPDNTYF